MIRIVLAIALYALRPVMALGTNWAVLVAGSNTWGNYRHQADICHAFHILHDLGNIPSSQIVVLMADDIAQNPENPFKGNIINYPNGPNVYPGVNKNYTGEEVTAKQFLSVLENLPSTSEDNVFVYFADHGAKGMVAMPYGDPLYADQLMATLHGMHKRKQFHEMVVYVEACESGSMFDKLLESDINIYATTAADDDHSSFAWFFDEKRGVYIADQYSIMWMMDSQNNMTRGETLRSQFELVKAETNESSVEMFGDLSIQEELVENFHANGFFSTSPKQEWGRSLFDLEPFEVYPASQYELLVDSRDVKLKTLESRWRYARRTQDTAKMADLKHQINDEIRYRKFVDATFEDIVKRVVYRTNTKLTAAIDWWFKLQMEVQDYDCLRKSFNTYHNHCPRGFEDYSLKYVRVLSNLCGIASTKEHVLEGILRACSGTSITERRKEMISLN